MIDSGSQITSVSESFYWSLNPLPELGDTKDFGLTVYSANGSQLAYLGYVKADVSVPSVGTIKQGIPIPVVKDTDYNKVVPTIIGTNVIREFREHRFDTDIPEAWLTAIDSLCDSAI